MLLIHPLVGVGSQALFCKKTAQASSSLGVREPREHGSLWCQGERRGARQEALSWVPPLRQCAQPEATYLAPELVPASPAEPARGGAEDGQPDQAPPPARVPLLPTDPEEAAEEVARLRAAGLPLASILGERFLLDACLHHLLRRASWVRAFPSYLLSQPAA